LLMLQMEHFIISCNILPEYSAVGPKVQQRLAIWAHGSK
jgi:hypothetical protein